MKIDNDQKFSQSYLESKIIQYLQYKWGYILKDRELSVPMRCGYEQVDIDIIYTNSIFFMWQTGKKWCEYEYPSERDLIGFTLQCKRYVAQARHDDGITFFFYSIIIFLPLHFILFKRYFIIWLNVILFKECPTKVPANIWKMQNDCYNVGWKGYPKWYAFSKRKLKRLGQRAIYRCACNSFFCLLSVAFCLHISTTCHLEFFSKNMKASVHVTLILLSYHSNRIWLLFVDCYRLYFYFIWLQSKHAKEHTVLNNRK